MSFISDYLYWRGDLTFEKAPFNEIERIEKTNYSLEIHCKVSYD